MDDDDDVDDRRFQKGDEHERMKDDQDESLGAVQLFSTPSWPAKLLPLLSDGEMPVVVWHELNSVDSFACSSFGRPRKYDNKFVTDTHTHTKKGMIRFPFCNCWPFSKSVWSEMEWNIIAKTSFAAATTQREEWTKWSWRDLQTKGTLLWKDNQRISVISKYVPEWQLHSATTTTKQRKKNRRCITQGLQSTRSNKEYKIFGH